ncbi:MAG: hypothetical protein K5856_05990 [Bacteroidaceae bacterium]|nr:hypothetical protein [Bacteroidaceae bacterium]
MNNQQNNITLESIAQQKAAIKKRLDSQKQKMSALSNDFIAPLKPTAKKSSAVMGLFNTGMVVFDGALIGFKLLRRLKKVFK